MRPAAVSTSSRPMSGLEVMLMITPCAPAMLVSSSGEEKMCIRDRPSYSVEDLFPYGHGEKSVFLIERFMKLHIEEAVAIRWHMGGFDDADVYKRQE